MPAYHPMKKHMEKLDEWGASASKKLSSSKDSGSSLGSRFNSARGKDDRWERTKPATANAEEDETNIVPQRSARVGQLPPPPPAIGVGKVRPPPPPARTASGSSTAPPPAPARGKAPPPPLPRRMDNEAGTDRPPPPYANNTVAPLPSSRSLSSAGHIEFSKFTEDDKQAFFDLLDEFFESRVSGRIPSTGESSSSRSIASPLANDRLPIQKTHIIEEAPKPSGPGAKASLFPKVDQKAQKPTAISSPAYTYPTLSACSRPATELCTALTCSTFLCYPDSYPEWSGSQPWFVGPNAVPSSLEGRTDVARTSSWQYVGSNYTLFGAALFADLSHLWYRITWDSNNPATTVKSTVAYREPPTVWQDDERLIEAHQHYGDWIASFAETNERNRTPVGDGECWTLAAEAIKYTNATAQLTEANRLMTTVGRTHGYLLYAGKVDEIKGQCGRWRGGDRGRIRRGDIIEWLSSKCSIKGMKGGYATLGNPEHTAVIVEDSPAPRRDFNSRAKTTDHYSILGVKKSATPAEIRGAFLQKARQHHPDKRVGGDDDYIQRLNEAHATLSNLTLREEYDNQLRRNGGAPIPKRVSAEVDLDTMQIVEDYEPMTFYHPCRCGHGFYIDEAQMQQGQEVVNCNGCSEQIRVLWKDEQRQDKEPSSESDDDDDGQTEMAPWELGSVTTVEQSAGQVPTRRTYDLSQGSFTKGEIWIYRPVWESVYLSGPLNPAWPPSLPGWQQLT